MKRLSTWIMILIVAGGGAVGVWFYLKSKKKEPLAFETTPVQKGHVVAKVTASGTLSALVTVQVGAQVSGRINEINVDFNSPVKKGQIIAKIDPLIFQASVDQAKANYLAAAANLNKAKVSAADAQRQLERANALAADKLIAQADRDTAQANSDSAKAAVDAAAASVEQARASRNQADINLQYTTIYAPIDGVVISRNVDVGQTVASALQAPTLFTIAQDPKKMQVDTSVAEADVGRLKDGMSASFTVDAYPSERFNGKVRQIRNAPQTVQNVVTYDAVIDVDNEELKLKPGMTANVTFVWAEKTDVLTVPNSALRFRPPPEAMPPGMDGGSSGHRHHRGDAGPEAAGGQSPPVASADGSAPTPGEPKRPRDRGGERATDATTGASGSGKRDGAGGPPPDRRTVWILKGEHDLQPVRVKTGVTDGTITEIVDGKLEEGDQVITDVSGGAGGKPAAPQGPGQGGNRGFGRVL